VKLVTRKDDADYIVGNVREHTDWFRDSLPMIASENVISPMAREMMASDFCDRYAEGLPGARYYQGNTFVDRVEVRATELAKELFQVPYADTRPISGTVANLGVLFALTKPTDVVTVPNISDGAHISTARFGAVGVRGLEPVTYPFDVENMNIDVDAAIKVIREVKPKLALFGMSVYLFPSPITEMIDALREVDAMVWYDAAHVLGLIAGKRFQDPFREGVDVMTGSTHKTLPGPQHGIILADPKTERMSEEKFLRKLNYGVFPGVLSNHHLHTMAALGISLAEHLEFGEEYAGQIISNAQALGQAMHERGFKVLCEHLGFTGSHTIAVDVKELGGGTPLVEALERANIITNKNLLPWDPTDAAMNPSGIRLGTQELTRVGMKGSEMDEVAELFKRICIDKEDPRTVREDVVELKNGFQDIQYCFEGGKAYKYHHIVE